MCVLYIFVANLDTFNFPLVFIVKITCGVGKHWEAIFFSLTSLSWFSVWDKVWTVHEYTHKHTHSQITTRTQCVRLFFFLQLSNERIGEAWLEILTKEHRVEQFIEQIRQSNNLLRDAVVSNDIEFQRLILRWKLWRKEKTTLGGGGGGEREAKRQHRTWEMRERT